MTRSAKLWRLFLMVVVALPVGAIVLQGVRQSREAFAKQTTKDRLKQIELALHQYHDEHHTFPPAFVPGPDGRMWHSWRTLLLPYLGEQELSNKYRFDEPWDGPHNRELAAACPEVFQSPYRGVEPGRANFYGVIGRRTAWPAQHAISINRALDGASNTIHVVEGPPVAMWLEPRDLTVREWIDDFRNQSRTGSIVGLMDGTVRFLSNRIDQTVLASLLTPRYGQLMYSGPDWPVEMTETAVLFQTLETRNVADMKQTDVLATSSCNLDPTKNLIWCAAFQLTWDELRDNVGGNVKTTPQPRLVSELNSSPFNRGSLSPETYLAVATGTSPPESLKLKESIQGKFPQLMPQIESLLDDGLNSLRLYACLVKTMPYIEQMDRFPKPLPFRGSETSTSVMSFGRIPCMNQGLGEVVLHEQVCVGDYFSDDDFVLLLKTISSQKDEIILARTKPGDSLQVMWNAIAARLQSPHPHRVHADLHDAERLEIPILELGIEKQFDELHGVHIEGIGTENHIGIARESILFRLNETGAELIAEAESMVVGENGFPEVPFDPTRPRRFVFDQPFFIALREKGASEPYFLGWIAHPEVMVLASETP